MTSVEFASFFNSDVNNSAHLNLIRDKSGFELRSDVCSLQSQHQNQVAYECPLYFSFIWTFFQAGTFFLASSGFHNDYIQTLQHQDDRLADSIAYLKSDHLPPTNKIAHSLLLTVNDYFLDHDILYHLWTRTGRKKKGPFVQLVVPDGLQLQIMQASHDDVLAGHLGVAKTYEVIRQRFYWFNIFHEIPCCCY